MAEGWWRRLTGAVDAFTRTLSGRCAPDCMGTERLERMLSAAPMVLYVLRWSPDHTPVYISANIEHFTGLTMHQVLERPERWLTAIHADDRDAYRRALDALPQQGRLALDYRVRHVEGGWRWVRDEARVKLDAHGQPVEVVGSWLDITDRRHSEMALAASEAQLRAAQTLLTDALESSGDAFSLFDAEDRLVAHNSRYKEFYPSIAHLIRPGVSFTELLRVSAERGEYQDVGPGQVAEWLAERMEHHRSAQGVFEQQMANGRHLEIIERPTMDGGRVAIRRDVTARKKVEAALRQELAFKQVLIDALPFPVYYKDREGRYLGCNTKFADVVGRPIADIVNRTVHDIAPANRAAIYSRYDQELLADPGVQTRELTMEMGDGSLHHMIVVKGLFTGADGAVAGIIGSMIDVTSQKRAEEQLVQAAKLATLGQIASEVAHELNQPLSIIRMSAERCLQGEVAMDAEQTARKLSTIVDQVARMAEMVDHLRSFSRIESGEPQVFSPAPVVTAAANLLAPHFQLDDIRLDLRVADDCPDIMGQPNQLEQVVLNLVGNARDAVRAHCSPGVGWVELSLSAEGETVTLSVGDNGGGVPESMWPLVFDPFFTTKAAGAGTGLGLSISANIVAGMGGEIQGHNTDDGASFIITIPVHHAAPAADTPSVASPTVVAPTVATPPRTKVETSPAATQSAPLPQGRILVVDDEVLSVECIVEFLNAHGFDAVGATTPAQALTLARDIRPDLAICDLRLPGLPGSALLVRLRAEHGPLPAILMTGGPLPTDMNAADTLLLGKPVALTQLRDNVQRLLTAKGVSPCHG